MNSSIAKKAFLSMSAVLALMAVLIIYQVPQPWRGALVGWLLFMASLGVFVLRLLRHYLEYKSLQLKSSNRRLEPSRPTRKPAAHIDGLKVIMSNSGGAGRRTIR